MIDMFSLITEPKEPTMVAWNDEPTTVTIERQPNPLAVRRTILRRGAARLWEKRDTVIEQGLAVQALDYELIEEMAKAADIIEGIALETAAVIIDRAEIEQPGEPVDEIEFVPFWAAVQ